jgi:hypothetical protein
MAARGKACEGMKAAPTAFTFDSDFMVARFHPNGSLDRSFDNLEGAPNGKQ